MSVILRGNGDGGLSDKIHSLPRPLIVMVKAESAIRAVTRDEVEDHIWNLWRFVAPKNYRPWLVAAMADEEKRAQQLGIVEEPFSTPELEDYIESAVSLYERSVHIQSTLYQHRQYVPMCRPSHADPTGSYPVKVPPADVLEYLSHGYTLITRYKPTLIPKYKAEEAEPIKVAKSLIEF